MNAKQIRSLLAVHEQGSIQKAAKSLYLAPSSISAQLKELAQELGVELFINRGRNIVLSDVGVSLLPSFQAFLAQESLIKQQAQAASQSLSGSLTLFAPSSMCIYRLPHIIERLQAVAPNLELLLTHEPFDFASALQQGNIDGAIMVIDQLPDQIQWDYHLLYREPVIYVTHPQRHQAKVLTLEDMAQQSIITTEAGCTYRQRAQQHFLQEGVDFQCKQSFSNVEVVKQCLLANMGMGLLPRCVVANELQTGQLIEQAVAGTPYEFSSYLITPKSESVPAKLQALIQIVKQLG